MKIFNRTYLFIKNIEGKKFQGKTSGNSEVKMFKKWLKLYKQGKRFPSHVGRKVSFRHETETNFSACAIQFPFTVRETLNKSLPKRSQAGLHSTQEIK